MHTSYNRHLFNIYITISIRNVPKVLVSGFTSNGIDHSSNNSHTQPATGLAEGRHRSPVVAESVESLHTAEGSAVTPTSSLQSGVPS